MDNNIENIVRQMDINGEFIKAEKFGSGHINDTFKITVKYNNETNYYILQKINKNIFTNPENVMTNIINVTSFLRKKIIENNGNPKRETMTVIMTKTNKTFFVDNKGDYWRAYVFIDNAKSYDLVLDEEIFYQSAVAFGHFQALLADFPIEILFETIPDFHNTPKRYSRLLKVIDDDICDRVKTAQKEIDFIKNRANELDIALSMLKNKQLPLRVTHNDTKLNNVMIDNTTGKAICVVDLDTVMPGLSINDFGDSIRFGAMTAEEDETDLSKVKFSLKLFEIYTKGYLESCKHILTEQEIKMLPLGAKLMTLECGIRFLADYLSGDIYFKIHRKVHNLDRARTQFALVEDMELKWDEIEQIINNLV